MYQTFLKHKQDTNNKTYASYIPRMKKENPDIKQRSNKKTYLYLLFLISPHV